MFEANLLDNGWQYDLVLTSETIYRLDGLDALIGLMRSACGYGAKTNNPEGGFDEAMQRKLSLDTCSDEETLHNPTYTCLVAAKVLYFGVGGGVSEFVRAVEESSQDGRQGKGLGKIETVWEKKGGVGRKVMSVEWSP